MPRRALIDPQLSATNRRWQTTAPGKPIAHLRRRPSLVLTVTETGIGIPREQLPHVFEMFSQGRSALDRSQGSLGIGLALARRPLAMHGGRIEARSDAPGRGSAFIVRLPVVSEVFVLEPLQPDNPEGPADHAMWVHASCAADTHCQGHLDSSH